MALPSVAALQNSSNITSVNSGIEGVKVKQECPDEAEIRELAAKMVEANKAKMAAVRAAPVPGAPPLQPGQIGQPGLLNYFSRTNITITKANNEKEKKAPTPDPDKKPQCDEESLHGRFGWETLASNIHIPYIFRYGEKYCAVRMVEMKLLNKYLNYLHSDIYSCTCIRSYYITEVEARLLNEINVRHCEQQFGREPFTCKDLVVRLQDASEFHNFLDVCYCKLLLSSKDPKDRCGFIRINGESVVPYTVREGCKYVPLFYFEGETDNLKLKAEKLEGWDLAYLKFCCKVQGIRNELFASETCSVISLSDIKSYFPPGTVFEDYWPSNIVDSQLIVTSSNSKKGNTAPSVGMWTKQPVIPPSNPVSTTNILPTPKTPTVTHPSNSQVSNPVNMNSQIVNNGWPGLVGGQAAYQPSMMPQAGQVIRMTQASIPMHNVSPTTTAPRNFSPVRPRAAPQYYPQVSLPMSMANQNPSHMAIAQPPPLVRQTGAAPTLGASTYTSTAGLNLPNVSPSSLHLMSMSDPAHHQMRLAPPHTSPLMHPPAQHTGVYTPPVMRSPQAQQRHTPPNNATNNTNNNNSAKFPPPLIPVNGTSRYPSNVYSAGSDVIDLSSPPHSPHRSAIGNGRSNDAIAHKLKQISETTTSGTHIPYQVQKAYFENKLVPCINSKPFIYSELLMTLPDLISHFFPLISLPVCKQVLQDVLRLELYQGNRQQMQILHEAGKCQSINDILPLVQLRDVMQYMPQMKYMFKSMSASEENPAKRQRTS